MFTLSDLMRAAQGGAALNNMAHQFGVSLEQTQRAMDVLMPAFSMAFRRNATDPMGFSNLMRMMASGRYTSFFDQPGQAFTPFALNQGNDIVAQLFGAEAGKRVAEQAAAWAGIAPEIMKQMLPITAAMLMGGLFRSAATDGLADFFEKLAETLRGKDAQTLDSRNEAAAPAMPNPFQMWADLMSGRAGAAPAADASPRPRADAPPPSPFGPWGDMMNAMLAAGQSPAPPRAPEPPPQAASLPNPVQFFGRMFETGIDAQQQHLATLQNIFDTYWGADHKRR